jgi:two-component system LytT family sensor kinase
MTNKFWLYWSMQLLGWGSIIGMSLLMEYFRNNSIGVNRWIDAALFLIVALSVSHVYRTLIIRLNFLGQRITRSIPVVLVGSLALCVSLLSLDLLKDYILKPDFKLESKEIISGLLSYYIFSLLWSVIYFSFHFFDRAREQELINLQLESSQKDSELNNLKNQLNPHFMFNSMNSIRALVDEDPNLAKKSITQLSNLLRSSLQLGNKRLISLQEEMTIVSDYLNLEKIRFEERLMIKVEIDNALMNFLVPPLMIQTLTENAIKHGISKRAKGGKVRLKSYLNEQKQTLIIEVWNDGVYNPKKSTKEGIGLENTRQRLRILFGKNAGVEIENIEGMVLTTLEIPSILYDEVKTNTLK